MFDIRDGLRLIAWRWRNRTFWFQRRSPVFELNTRIYEGLPGSGKTLLMVHDVLKLMEAGVRVYSNLYVRDPISGRETLPLGSWLDMLRASVSCLEDGMPTVFAIDEIHLMCDARSWQNTPGWWLNLMAQRRHFGVAILGTTQDLTSVEKRLRQLVGVVIRVRPLVPRWIRWPKVLRHVPIYLTASLDPNASEGQEVKTGSWSPHLMSWMAYHAYSTQEVMVSDDFTSYDDKASASVVSELTARARELSAVSKLPAFADLFLAGCDDDTPTDTPPFIAEGFST